MVGQVKSVKIVEGIGEFIASGLFAVMVLAVTFVWTAAMLILMFWPQKFGAEAGFATLFRMWCFGYDPVSGHFDIERVALFLMDPIFFGVVVGAVWRNSLVTTLVHRKAATGAIFVTVSALVAVGLVTLARNQDAIAAKTGIHELTVVRNFAIAPPIKLIDQSSHIFSPPKGQVSVVAAFYSHCEHMCPLLIKELKAALKQIPRAAEINVVLVTLDPDRDDPQSLQGMMTREDLDKNWHLLTGQKGEVEKVLDAYNVARAKDKSGNIGHSNVFYIVDKGGRLAFMIGLGTPQEKQLRAVFEVLLNERG